MNKDLKIVNKSKQLVKEKNSIDESIKDMKKFILKIEKIKKA